MSRKEIVVRLARIRQLVGEVPEGLVSGHAENGRRANCGGEDFELLWPSTRGPLFDDRAVESWGDRGRKPNARGY